jgi:Fe-S-cluster-containing dehydrogenase component
MIRLEKRGEYRMARYGIVVKADRCTGCMTCVVGCKQENLTLPTVWWMRILKLEDPYFDHIFYLPHTCMHCDDPPCVPACPEHAIFKRPDGIVLIDHEKCKGHGDCVKACPYGVISLNPEYDYFTEETIPLEKMTHAYQTHLPHKASKCTLCIHRIEKEKEPICVSGCPSKALIFGDLEDPNSLIRRELWKSVQLLQSKVTNPKISYIFSKNIMKKAEQRIIENPNMKD